MTKPLGNEDLSATPGERVIDKPELPAQGITNENEAVTETVAGELQLKRGRSGKFEVLCDEPGMMGGEGAHPTPLGYISMGVGF